MPKKQISPLINSSKNNSINEDKKDNKRKSFEELGISSQQIRILFDNLPQGVALFKIICDESSKPVGLVLLENNKQYNNLNLFKRYDRIRSEQFKLSLKNKSLNWLDVYNKVATTGKPHNFEAFEKSRDRWFQVYAYSPKRDFVILVFTDVTKQKKRNARDIEDRKRWMQELINSETKYRRLYETTHDGIMARNLLGRMIDCNKAYAKMLGYSKKELKNLSIQDLLPEKWLDQREKVVKKVLQTGHSIVFEREYKRKDNSIFPASVRTWRLTDDKRKVVGIWSLVRDISEQKEQQKNLEQHAGMLQNLIDERTSQLKVSERLATIGQTAGMVGHDLRNPLQTIAGELYLAKIEVESLSEGEPKSNLQESLQTIEEQAIYMDKIVSDLQAFVRPIKINKTPINLVEIVEGVISSITIPANISVQTRMDNNFPQLKADPQLVKRVLINLVTNAVQAMPDGGRLTVKSLAYPEGPVFVTVEDTGVGIPEKIKPQIFTPLFTTKPRGQGFGLAVCKRVIEAHGGTICFESQEGKGTKFTIQFPAN
jgi:PAS domain S-box-containing protein